MSKNNKKGTIECFLIKMRKTDRHEVDKKILSRNFGIIKILFKPTNPGKHTMT